MSSEKMMRKDRVEMMMFLCVLLGFFSVKKCDSCCGLMMNFIVVVKSILSSSERGIVVFILRSGVVFVDLLSVLSEL